MGYHRGGHIPAWGLTAALYGSVLEDNTELELTKGTNSDSSGILWYFCWHRRFGGLYFIHLQDIIYIVEDIMEKHGSCFNGSYLYSKLYSVFATKSDLSMLFRETVAVYCENHREHK
jgi:hypothetical protein